MSKKSKHIENSEEYKSLNVNKGIVQPNSINPNTKYIKSKKKLSVNEYVDGIKSGNRTILSQAITFIESKLPKHQEIAQKIIEKCLPYSGKSIRIGITGVPGVGKSSFIETFGLNIVKKQKKKIAVLAIDPSSNKTKGSILGDKTRMEQLSNEENAYIRPSPSVGALGGVAQKTRETIILCEAAGFDVILIETVGVGQSEIAVHSMVDYFLLLMLSGAGDELQGIKRGIMEMADSITITKADNKNIQKANLAKLEYQNALHLFPPSKSGWIPTVTTCSALENSGINNIWETINNYVKLTKDNKYFDKNRDEQAKYWMYETINDYIKNIFYNDENIKTLLEQNESKVVGKEVTSYKAAEILLNAFKNK